MRRPFFVNLTMAKEVIRQVDIPFYTRIFDFISLALMLATWTVPLMAYSDLPETVPSHINFKGEVDGYSNKIFIFVIPVIGTITTAMLWFVMHTKNPYFQKFRKPGKYQVQLSEKAQHRVLSIIILLISILFLIVEMSLVETATTGSLPSYFFIILPIIALLIILPLVEAFRSK